MENQKPKPKTKTNVRAHTVRCRRCARLFLVISGYFWLFLGVEQVRYTDRFLEKLYHLHDIYVMISVVIQQYFSNILKGLSFAIQLTVV